VHVKRGRDNDTGRCAERFCYEHVHKPRAMSPMSFFFRTSFHFVCEGRLYDFQLRITLHGVKNAVECVLQAGNDDSCCNQSKQLTVFVKTKMRLCALRGMFSEFLTGEGRFLSESLWRTSLRGGGHALWWVRGRLV